MFKTLDADGNEVLQVSELAGFLEVLRARGVEIEGRILEWERGKHAWIRDPDGNRVELYEEILRV